MKDNEVRQYLVDPNPSRDGAVLLHRHFRKRVKDSFLLLVREIAQSLRKDYQQQISFLESIDDSRRLSVLVYYYYFSLLGYVAVNNIGEMTALCDSLLKNLNEKNIYKDEISVESARGDTWERNFLNDVVNQEGASFEALDEESLEKNRKNIHIVMDIIAKVDADMAAELRDHVSMLFVPKIRISNYFVSGSGVKYFGVPFITSPHEEYDPLLYFFDLIIHEVSHLHLNVIMGFDPIVLNEPSDRYHSPARNASRPMKGIFHAHFVFYRLVMMYLKAWKHFNSSDEPLPRDFPAEVLDQGIGEQPWEYKHRLCAWIYKFKKGEIVIRQHAKFTEIGLELFEAMSKNVAKKLEEKGLEWI